MVKTAKKGKGKGEKASNEILYVAHVWGELGEKLEGEQVQRQNKKKKDNIEDAEITDWFLAIDSCLA